MTHDEALALARKHVDCEVDDAYPECQQCNQIMECEQGDVPCAMCSACTYNAMDVVAAAFISLHAELEAMRMTDEELRCLAWARRQIEVPYSCEPSGTRKGAIEALDRLLAGRGR